MNTINDNVYLRRCLEIAELGLGNAAPNPMVGSVIVHNNKIIGEGYHRKCGEAHAEVNAVNSVENGELLKKSTLYVNLEPCSHYGRTPPCSDLIIEKKIPRVVIGCIDSFAKGSSRGVERLKSAGIEVVTNVLEKESLELNRRFFTFHSKKRPYIILKWAQTLDGFIDAKRTKDTPIQPLWITNKIARTLVHKWRTEEQSILVGTNTAEKDNPKLNVRDWAGSNPTRLLIDRNLRLNNSLSLFDGSIPTVIFTDKHKASKKNTEYLTIDFDDKNDKGGLKQILTNLHDRNLISVIVEGGSSILRSFIEQNLWDEARIFTGNKYFGEGTKAPEFPFNPSKEENFDGSFLKYYRNV